MFGNYHRDSQLNPSIWLGKENDAAVDADVCIKVVTVPEHDDRDTTAAERLLFSAAIQQAIAEHSSRWAPVLQLGSNGIESFYVTHRFPRSLQTLIDQKCHVSPPQLRSIMLAILEALIDLEHTYNLAHGNLKPSNVFLSGPVDIDEHCIRLGDPDGTNTDNPVLSRSFDIRAMGQILYSLVTFSHHSIARYPLTNFNPWKRLGPSGKRWFDLCNQLLGTPSNPGLAELADLRAQIARIKAPLQRSLLMSVFSF